MSRTGAPTDLKEIFGTFKSERLADRPAFYLFPSVLSAESPLYSKTYGEFYQEICHLARFLEFSFKDHKGPKGVIALAGPNSYEWALAFWAILMSGHKVLLLDHQIVDDHLIGLMKEVEVCGLIAASGLLTRIRREHHDYLKGRFTLSFNDRGKIFDHMSSYYDLFGGVLVAKAPLAGRALCDQTLNGWTLNRDEEIIFIHTSGTTGDYNLVGLSSNMVSVFLEQLRVDNHLSVEDCTLAILPLHHVFGLLSSFLSPLYVGQKIALLREMSSLNVLMAIRLAKVTCISAVPALWKLFYTAIQQKLRKLPAPLAQFYRAYQNYFPNPSWLDSLIFFPVRRGLGRHLRLFVSGGAKGDVEILTFFARLGITTMQGYGMTETGGILTLSDPRRAKDKLATVGRPMGTTEIVVKDPDEQGIGELWVRGPQLFRGYYHAGSYDRSLFDEQGFFCTGDLGRIDSDQHVIICGRKKNIIVLSSGKNVYPEEIEEHYLHSPLIKEMMVMGQEFDGEEKIGAIIVPDFEAITQANQGRKLSLIEVAKLLRVEMDALALGLPSYKRIFHFEVETKELPKTTTRKVIRAEVLAHKTALQTTESPAATQIASAVELVFQQIFSEAFPHLLQGRSFAEIKSQDMESELGLDSILRAELCYRVSHRLGCAIDLSRLNHLRTLGQVLELFESTSAGNAKITISSSVATVDAPPPESVSFFDLSSDSMKRRLKNIQQKIGQTLSIAQPLAGSATLKGHIENYIGETLIPTGVAGPVQVCGEAARGQFYVPLATTEGALVASVHRGMQVINASGGAQVRVLENQIIRSPAFVLANLEAAVLFVQWIFANESRLQRVVESTSRFAKLKQIRPYQYGRRVILRLAYDSGDAAGQNMCTIASDAVKSFIEAQSPVAIETSVLDNNLSGDKKFNFLNFTQCRGRRVTAEVQIPFPVVEAFFHTTAERIVLFAREGAIGSVLSGMVGVNAHYANMIAAIFIATGQDVASTHEAAVGVTNFELDSLHQKLIVTVLLPSLVVGTVGGGTSLPSQMENLKIMECHRASVNKLAEIIACAVLAGELSIVGSHAAGDFTKAHALHGRA